MSNVIVKTGRFGEVIVSKDEIIQFPSGLLGFADLTEFCLLDLNDDTLIMWLQSTQRPDFVLPVLEPKIFRPDYVVRLSGMELRDLGLNRVSDAAVLSVLTIPENIAEMSANLKAPIVIHLNQKIGKQVILQENDYAIKVPMFKELRTHLLTIESQQTSKQKSESQKQKIQAVSIQSIEPSHSVRSLIS